MSSHPSTTSRRPPPLARVGMALMAVLAVAACGGSGSASLASTLVPASPPAGFPGWPIGPDPDAQMVPIIVSSERAVGSNRFLYALTDSANKPIASPELATTVRFFDLASDPATPVSEATGTFIWTVPDELGLYHATVDFTQAGPWGVEIVASAPGQPDRTARAVFDVRGTTTTPAIGAAAPASDTPTATDAAGIAAISTDEQPDPAFYRTSVNEALAAGKPFVLAFATPLFCSSRTCGPTMETVKMAVAPYGDSIEVIHVEPYELHLVDGQPQLTVDANGGFKVVPSAIEWGIPIEPYIFVVGTDGRVAAKFEGAIGADELQRAIDGVVGQPS
ncbi:MAG TPA: hypothetical protein VFW02_06055 [Candidatus Limnocylindrales bacterium]|nr:hypothetical protein [Candidatus Limnocylindrales bacterium]